MSRVASPAPRVLAAYAREHPWLDGGTVPEHLFGPHEQTLVAGLVFPARRHKWLLGRLAAKALVRSCLCDAQGIDVEDRAVMILNEESGAPYVHVDGVGQLPWCLSISHRRGFGVAAVACSSELAIGVDVEVVEPRARSFVTDFFAKEELERSFGSSEGRDLDLRVTRGWSAKEAVLKALRVGLRLDTRSIVVGEPRAPEPDDLVPPGFAPLAVSVPALPGPLSVCWRDEGAHVLTLAVIRKSSEPGPRGFGTVTSRDARPDAR